jgi:hypothetical protein
MYKSFTYKCLTGFILVAGALLISGCATSPSVTDPEVFSVTPKTNAFSEIRSISVEARDELRLLAKYQEALALESLTEEQHKQKFHQATYIPQGFDIEVDLKVTDRALKVAQAIATMAGYEIEVDGKPIVKEPFVSIDIENRPLNDALKELGAQTGDLITLEIYPAANLMIFKYNNENV